MAAFGSGVPRSHRRIGSAAIDTGRTVFSMDAGGPAALHPETERQLAAPDHHHLIS
jgi:hypothetical protein